MTSQTPETLPPNTLRACLIPGANIKVDDVIRPCQPSQEWMDEIPQKYIYRCIPLVAANTMGWELLNPVRSQVSWTGGDMNTDVQIKSDDQSPFGASSHFGVGTVTWYLPFLFRTSADLGLLVTGPANHGHNHAVPLDAFVRTDWLPFPFTMSWRLTHKETPVTFEAGEAICRILPYPIALLNETQLEITELSADRGFFAEVNQWGQARAQNVARQQADAKAWLEGGDKPTGEGVWNSQYVRAKGVTSDGFEPHQTIFKPAKPVDRRS